MPFGIMSRDRKFIAMPLTQSVCAVEHKYASVQDMVLCFSAHNQLITNS